MPIYGWGKMKEKKKNVDEPKKEHVMPLIFFGSQNTFQV